MASSHSQDMSISLFPFLCFSLVYHYPVIRASSVINKPWPVYEATCSINVMEFISVKPSGGDDPVALVYDDKQKKEPLRAKWGAAFKHPAVVKRASVSFAW